MQLAQAMDAWVDAHGASLSVSTQRDIEHIRAAVVEVGWHELPHDEVDREVREDVIDEATREGTLGGSAITEFFGVVLAWADAEEANRGGDDDGLGPTGAFHDQDDDDESDADESDDNDEPADESESKSESDDDDDYDDYDDYEESDDDDDDDDDDESADHDPEDWVGYLGTAQDGDDFTGLPPENEADADTETAAASSFFNAIDSSTPTDDEPVVVIEEEDSSSPETNGGVFSTAAEHIPPKPATGIDWITVAYFAVAAICFALVIYFYLSSN
jgi:hypothetical protein